jgi:pimeloyl-ACP methyl ester carboxylesterase
MVAAAFAVLTLLLQTPSSPPAMAELALTSHGARINGLVYLAAGEGPHPVVLFLHGYPGNERNLDLAQAVRRAGFDAVFIDYRGNWGSGGTFSFANSLGDVDSVLAWIRSPEAAAKYHFDTRRIAIFGHSFGGWLALMTGAHEQPSVCVAAAAAWNVGWAAARFADHPDERKSYVDEAAGYTGVGGPFHANASDLVAEITAHAAQWNYIGQAGALKNHAVFLAAASRDSADEDPAMHAQLAAALKKAGAVNVTNITFDDDHPFSAHRLELADAFVKWLRSDCEMTWKRR